MNVILAKSAGFCPGVARAVDIAMSGLAAKGGAWSDGPLIHNSQMVEKLRRMGLDISEDGPRPGKPILIRAHGVDNGKRRVWESAGHEILDATCPYVAKSQALAAQAMAEGKTVVMAGDAGHAEIVAVLGPACGCARIVSDAAEIPNLDFPENAAPVLLSQTTFDASRFEDIADAVCKRFPDAEIHRTVCSETSRRQDEVRSLAASVDAMVVAGGRDSANTRRLAELSRKANVPTFVVESVEELDANGFAAFETVGLSAGASTPDWVIEEIRARLSGMETDPRQAKNRLVPILAPAAGIRL